VGGILAVGPVVQRLLESRVLRLILALLATSPGPQIATFPLVVARFCVYYPSGLLVGVILVPLTTAVLWDALAWDVVFVVPWPFLYDLRAQAFAILYQLIERTTAVFGSAPGFLVGHEALSLAFMAFPCLHVPASRGSQGRRLES